MEAIFDSEKTGRAKLRVSPVRGTYEDSHAVTHLLMVPASCEHYLPGELARFYILVCSFLIYVKLFSAFVRSVQTKQEVCRLHLGTYWHLDS